MPLMATVAGHAGKLLGATVGQSTWALLKGRVHLYEGRPAADVTAGIRLLKSLGCRTVILTNAAGTLHPQHPPGSWMQITDHLNLQGTTPLRRLGQADEVAQAVVALVENDFINGTILNVNGGLSI